MRLRPSEPWSLRWQRKLLFLLLLQVFAAHIYFMQLLQHCT